MALMNFREPNQVKWVGVRPAHNGEQINIGNFVVNGAVTLYTVPAGKILLLIEISASKWTNYVGSIFVEARTAASVWIRSFCMMEIGNANDVAMRAENFVPPFELYATEHLDLHVTGTDLQGYCNGTGILIDT